MYGQLTDKGETKPKFISYVEICQCSKGEKQYKKYALYRFHCISYCHAE